MLIWNTDPTKANQLLDETVYNKKDADGFRTYPDGETISFTIEGTDQAGSSNEECRPADHQDVEPPLASSAPTSTSNAPLHRALRGQRKSKALLGRRPHSAPLSLQRLSSAAFSPTGPGRQVMPGGITTDQRGGVEPPKDHFIWKIWDIWDKVLLL